mgnify:CR=1 FL=1
MLFNIYYINTFKMYEIKMMINNRMKVTEQEEKQQKDEEGLEAEIEAGVKMPSIFNLKSRAKAQNITNDTRKFVENFDIKTTKSTMLKEVIDKCCDFSDLKKEKLQEGMLMKVDSLKVELTNSEEIMGVKVINNKTITMTYEGIDIGKVFDAAVKDYAYIFKAKNEKGEKFLFKIPVTFENEFESMYSVNDILIGKVGIIGIYKGEVEEDSIKNMIDIVDKSKKETENRTENIEIVDSDDMEKDNEGEQENLYHYLDIIAIIQELHIENKGEK